MPGRIGLNKLLKVTPPFRHFSFNIKVKGRKLKSRQLKRAKASNLILMTLLDALQALILCPLLFFQLTMTTSIRNRRSLIYY